MNKKFKDQTITEIMTALKHRPGTLTSANARGYIDALSSGAFNKTSAWTLDFNGQRRPGLESAKPTDLHEMEQEYIEGWREACADWGIDED